MVCHGVCCGTLRRSAHDRRCATGVCCGTLRHSAHMNTMPEYNDPNPNVKGVLLQLELAM
eukprot:6024368-Alexandrium_andersonii.AAC.1